MRYLIVLLLAGCATRASPVTSFGEGKFIVTVNDYTVGYSAQTMQAKAAQEAARHCESRGGVMKAENSSASGIGMWTAASASLVFSCVAK